MSFYKKKKIYGAKKHDLCSPEAAPTPGNWHWRGTEYANGCVGSALSSSLSFFGARYCLWFREIKLRAGRMGSPLCDKVREISFRKVTVDS